MSTTYSDDPAAALRAFAEAGAEWAHVVDLDGARAGKPVQHELIAELARTVPLKLQVAGGFRERDQLARMFDAGVARVVIGSLAVKEPRDGARLDRRIRTGPRSRCRSMSGIVDGAPHGGDQRMDRGQRPKPVGCRRDAFRRLGTCC